MSQDWANEIAEQLLSRALLQDGICLILGAADTGKTTLAAVLAGRLVRGRPVSVIDADIGQSHIGPPTTVGWAIVDKQHVDFSQLTPCGISFVGDITPVGHLLQLTAAIMQCVQQEAKLTELIIIDAHGFISGPAAAVLWWTVQQILRPKLILAVQQNNELSDILIGLQNIGSQLELIKSSPRIPAKSPQARRSYRQKQFNRYFQDSCLYNISLNKVAIQASRRLSNDSLTGRVIALRDEKGTDLAIGLIKDWQGNKDAVVIRAPQLDISQVRCLVIGDVTVDIADE